MIKERWTWIEEYKTKFLPKAPRKCSKCNYFGYFDLKKAIVIVPPRPGFYEICPDCGNIVELKEGENPVIELKEDSPIFLIGKELGLAPQEIIDKTFNNIILHFDPKTGKVKLINKDTGDEIKFYK